MASYVLSFIPSYYMHIFWLPQNICDTIDQTTCNIIWRDSNNKGIHLVGWNKIARVKHQGGLGSRRARETNICFLGKLVWDLLQSMPPLIPKIHPLGLPLCMLKMLSKTVSLGMRYLVVLPFDIFFGALLVHRLHCALHRHQ